MQRGLLSIVLLVAASCRVEAGCVDPALLAHSAVGIARYFDDEERKAQDGFGVRGSGWFLSPTLIATVEHVAAGMNLSDQRWKPIEIRTGESGQSVPARVQRIVGSNAEKIAVLELQTAPVGARGVDLRMEPLLADEPLASIAYPHDRQRVASGRFVEYGDGEGSAGTALLEMYDGNDRLALDYGASGAPVFDCTGRVVAVVSNLFTKTMQFMSQSIRVSTAWGSPNVASVPIQVLGSPRL
jgi:Trypsin-like peptidase domain